MIWPLLLCLKVSSPVVLEIPVPIDHSKPNGPKYSLCAEMASPFDASKPTLFVIADGQQFYVRKGRIENIAKPYGSAFNVVGIVGRGDAPDLARRCHRTNGKIDWSQAWTLYNSSQWVEDIEAVRTQLLGAHGKVLLRGVSGGAMMVHEYLARHGDKVSRAYTAAPVMPYLERELPRANPDFMLALKERDPGLPRLMLQLLKDHAQDREVITTAFQRQHYFVSADALSEAREALIRGLSTDYGATLSRVRKDYQVDAIEELAKSDAGMPMAVREYEFLAAAGKFDLPPDDQYDPEFESEYNFAAPLMSLCKKGMLPKPVMDLARLHQVKSDVFVLSGTQDRAVDYLTSISLAARYPNGHLLLVDDNHMFANLKEKGLTDELERTFLRFGYTSPEMSSVLDRLSAYRWRGQGG